MLRLSLAGMTSRALHVSITLSLLWSTLNPDIEHNLTLQVVTEQKAVESSTTITLHWRLEFSVGLNIVLNRIHREAPLSQPGH